MTFIFSGSHKKFSLVLLQITISTSTALKNVKKKRLQYSLNDSVTRFLSTENYNYSVSCLVDSVFKRRPRNDRNAMEVGGRAGQAKRKGNSCDDSKEIYQKV